MFDEIIKTIKELNASMIQLRAEIVGLSREVAALRQVQQTKNTFNPIT